MFYDNLLIRFIIKIFYIFIINFILKNYYKFFYLRFKYFIKKL